MVSLVNKFAEKELHKLLSVKESHELYERRRSFLELKRLSNVLSNLSLVKYLKPKEKEEEESNAGAGGSDGEGREPRFSY